MVQYRNPVMEKIRIGTCYTKCNNDRIYVEVTDFYRVAVTMSNAKRGILHS